MARSSYSGKKPVSAEYDVFRTFKNALESGIKKQLVEAVNRLHEENFLTKKEKEDGLNRTKDLNKRVQAITSKMRMKIQENGENLYTVLAALGTMRETKDTVKSMYDRLPKNHKDGKSRPRSNSGPKKKTDASSASAMKPDTSESVESSSDTSVPSKPFEAPVNQMQPPESDPQSMRSFLAPIGLLAPIPGSPSVSVKPSTGYQFPTADECEGSYPAGRENVVAGNAVVGTGEPPEQVTISLPKHCQETDVTQISYPPPTSRPIHNRTSSMPEADFRAEAKRIDEMSDIIRDSIASSTAQTVTAMIKENLPKVHERYKKLAEHYEKRYTEVEEENKRIKEEHKLEVKRASLQNEQLEEHFRKQSEHFRRQSDLEREGRAVLLVKLRTKEAEVSDLSDRLERAKADMEGIKRKLNSAMVAEQESVDDKIKIVEDIHTLICQIESLSKDEEGGGSVDILNDMQRKVLQLRDRPATTGGMKRTHH